MSRIIFLNVTIMVLGLLSISCAESQNIIKYNGDGFEFRYYSNINLVESLRGDYVVYNFNKENKVIMSAYLGYQPSFSYNTNDIEKTIKNSLEYQIVKTLDENGLINKEVLVKLEEEEIRYLHFWYKKLSKDEAEICDSIINSVIQTP